MSLIKTVEMVPEVYTNTSRDFQLLSRIYDVVINGVKFDIDSITTVINSSQCNNRLLSLLQTKVGFLTNGAYTDDEIRYVLKSFPQIVKNKGSKRSIEQAVRIFSKIHGIKSDVSVEIINKSDDLDKMYTISINLYTSEKDTSLLDEIFRYILPTGSIVKYNFYSTIINNTDDFNTYLQANIIILKDSVNSLIRGSYIQYRDTTEYDLIGSIGLTQLSTPFNLEYRGKISDVQDLPLYLNDSMLGYVYIYVEESESFDQSINYIKAYVCDYDENGDLAWCTFSSQDGSIDESKYNIYNNIVYGYINADLDEFYSNKLPAFYDKDQTYDGSGIRIDKPITDEHDEISPNNCSIYPITDRLVIDLLSGLIYSYNGTTWVELSSDLDAIEVYRSPMSSNGTGLVPKDSMVAANCTLDIHDNIVPIDSTTTPAIWVSEYRNNKYSWSSIIVDTELIKAYLKDIKYKKVLIMHSIEDAFVMPLMNSLIYIKNLKNSWISNGATWVDSLYSDMIEIYGSPLNANIKPAIGQHIYYVDLEDESNNVSWSYHGEELVNKINLQSDTIYIDSNTNCAFDNSLNEIIHIVKVGDTYNVDYSTLLFMLENHVIKPAFKNNTIIFEDSNNNMLLL